jgi:hypothetical protein
MRALCRLRDQTRFAHSRRYPRSYRIPFKPAGRGVGATLLRNRANDIEAILLAIANPVDDLDLMAVGPYPDDYDLDAAVDLCSRGIQELARVPLA